VVVQVDCVVVDFNIIPVIIIRSLAVHGDVIGKPIIANRRAVGTGAGAGIRLFGMDGTTAILASRQVRPVGLVAGSPIITMIRRTETRLFVFMPTVIWRIQYILVVRVIIEVILKVIALVEPVLLMWILMVALVPELNIIF